MARLLLLSTVPDAGRVVLPALELLGHDVEVLPCEPAALVRRPDADLVLLDARGDLSAARGMSRVIRATGVDTPLLAVFTEGGLTALNGQWQVDDIVLDRAGPAEVEARLRLALTRERGGAPPEQRGPITAGVLVVDEDSWSAKVKGQPMDLTYKEFELLKYLAQHPGRVFTRDQLLQEVWGVDYYGGTRTVDVHIRRLRAKLGPEHEALIGTIRNVGYRFAAGVTTPPAERVGREAPV